jgi:hypothetical protein
VASAIGGSTDAQVNPTVTVQQSVGQVRLPDRVTVFYAASFHEMHQFELTGLL